MGKYAFLLITIFSIGASMLSTSILDVNRAVINTVDSNSNSYPGRVPEDEHDTNGSFYANGSFYTSRRLTPHFGIEALDIDLNDPALTENEQFISQLKQDLVRHRAVLFRSQNLSGERQVNISTALGTLKKLPYGFSKPHPKSPHPAIFRVSNNKNEGFTGIGTDWHIDGVMEEKPYKYQLMYFPSVSEDGDTHFLPFKELWDSFSEDEKELYNKLWVKTGKKSNTPVHPLVYKHPFRPNEETMLIRFSQLSRWYIDDEESTKDDNVTRSINSINGVNMTSSMRSSDIRDQIVKKINSQLDIIGITMKWQKGDFFISDNLGLAHHATDGTQKSSEEVGLRILHRTQVFGGYETVPSKLDGCKSFMIEKPAKDSGPKRPRKKRDMHGKNRQRRHD